MVNEYELKNIANLANLYIDEDKKDEYLKNLDEILGFVEILNSIDLSEVDLTVSTNIQKNEFRKDEVIEFEDKQMLLQNSKDISQNMFMIPKVLN